MSALDFISSAFGTLDVAEAARLLAGEREGMIEIFERNKAQAQHIKRLDELLRLASDIMTGVEDYGGMFLDAKTRERMEKYRSLLRTHEKAIQEALKL